MADKVTRLRVRFIGGNTPESGKKGYFNNTMIDVKVKQTGEKLFVKRVEDTSGESVKEYQSFDEFCNHFTITFKYM